MWGQQQKSKDKKAIENANCRMIATTGCPKDFFDKPGCKEWLATLAENFGSPGLRDLGSSARTVGRNLKEKVDEVREDIRENGKKWAKAGVLSLQADHFVSRKATSENERSFLGIILCIRNKNFEMTKIPLCFETVKLKTFSQFRKDLHRTLKVNNILF